MNADEAIETVGKAAIWIGLAVLAFVLWQIRAAFLLLLGAAAAAILLHLLAGLVCRITRCPQGLGLLLATLIVLALIGLCGWLFGANLSVQFSDIMRRVQEGRRQLEAFLQGNPMGQAAIEKGTSYIGSTLSKVLTGSLGFLEVAIVLAVMAIYLAAQPNMYRNGLGRLFPPAIRPKALEAFDLIGASLKLWLLGQLVLMILVGVLSYIALLIVGLPNPLGLALIAGLTEIVPYLGPFIGAVPAILVALTQGLSSAVWIAGLYLLIHLVEGYLVGPPLQRWFVRIPPAVMLTSIFAAQLLFGFAGVVLAAPMAVVAFAALKILYVRDTLGLPADMPTKPPL